jgi:hypothetical protein
MPNRSLTRRSLLQILLASAACNMPLAHLIAVAQAGYGGSNGQQRGEMGRMAAAFRRQFSVPASSIAISRNGQFAYDEALGMGDRQHLSQVQQSSLFRIASVTMPITSVTVFSLIEQGRLNLTGKVFGPSAVLGTKIRQPTLQAIRRGHYGRPSPHPYRRRLARRLHRPNDAQFLLGSDQTHL